MSHSFPCLSCVETVGYCINTAGCLLAWRLVATMVLYEYDGKPVGLKTVCCDCLPLVFCTSIRIAELKNTNYNA